MAAVGNVFRNEALHAVGVDPRTRSRSLGPERLHELWQVLEPMMAQAVEDGRIEPRQVYKQERCQDCGAPVTVVQVGGRTAYVCPVEQPG